MGREIKLSGGEISLLKTLGLSGGSISGKTLAERSNELEPAEFLDTLVGLMDFDHVLADAVTIRTMEDVARASFRVNPAHAKDLRDAIHPGRHEPERRRQRRS